MLIIRGFLLSSYSKNFATSHHEPKDAQFEKKCMLHASESSFLPRFLVLFMKTTFCRSYVKILSEPNCAPNDGQFVKHWHAPLNQRFQLNVWYLSSQRYFKALNVKLTHNPIMTQKMANLQNAVTRFRIIVFIWLFGSYRVSDTLELLVRNSCWTALVPKRWSISKTL